VKTIKLSQASRPLAEYAADLHGEIIVLTERNRPVAAIVPLKRSDQESVALSGHPEFLALIARSRSEFQRGHTLSLAEMKKAFSRGRSPNTYQPSPRQVGGSSPSGRRRQSKRDR
jgi:antitoxin (DNA-binding transcriptional repressor) of toxin-antitoxin stability system